MTTDSIRLADRMQQIGMSPTMKGTVEAARLKSLGKDVVDLGAGEPDFPTPAHVTAAAHEALDRNFTKYTPNMGIGELREVHEHAAVIRVQPESRQDTFALGRRRSTHDAGRVEVAGVRRNAADVADRLEQHRAHGSSFL